MTYFGHFKIFGVHFENFERKSKSASKSMFPFEFRVGVWRNRFLITKLFLRSLKDKSLEKFEISTKIAFSTNFYTQNSRIGGPLR